MPRPGITYDQVAGAADGLLTENAPVTNRAVRDRLGSGSSGTVQRFLKQWRESQQPLTPVSILSDTALNQLNHEVARISAAARSEVTSRLVELQTELDDLAEINEQLEADLEQRRVSDEATAHENTVLAMRLSEKTAEIDRLMSEMDSTRRFLEDSRTVVADLKSLLQRREEQAEELLAKVNDLNSAFKVEQQQRIEAEKGSAILVEKYAAEQARTTVLATEKASLTEQLVTALGYGEMLRDETIRLSAELVETKAALSVKTAETDRWTEAFTILKAENQEANNSIAELRAQLAENQRMAHIYQTEAAVSVEKNSGLTTSLNLLNIELQRLAHDHTEERQARIAVEAKLSELSLLVATEKTRQGLPT